MSVEVHYEIPRALYEEDLGNGYQVKVRKIDKADPWGRQPGFEVSCMTTDGEFYQLLDGTFRTIAVAAYAGRDLVRLRLS